MTKDELADYIKKAKPKIIYLSGKTSTGKTTFSNYLKDDLGYIQIEFDQIVMDSVVKKYSAEDESGAFHVAYRDIGSDEWRKSFIKEARNSLLESLKKGFLVAEGAIANPATIKNIFSDKLENFLFVYFHPTDKKEYVRRIKERYLAGTGNDTSGLSKEFWTLLPSSAIKLDGMPREITPLIEQGIIKFAEFSIKKSQERLDLFRKSFPEITVVDA